MTTYITQYRGNGTISLEIRPTEEDGIPITLTVLHRQYLSKSKQIFPEDTAGAYILLDAFLTEENNRRVYIGESGNLNKRIIVDHLSKPPIDSWAIAVVLHNDPKTENGETLQTVDERKALEYLVWKRISKSKYVSAVNTQTKSPKLSVDETERIQELADIAVDALKIFGCDIATKATHNPWQITDNSMTPTSLKATDKNTTISKKNQQPNPPKHNPKKAYYRAKIRHLIELELIQPGEIIIMRDGDYTAEAEILDNQKPIQILRYGYNEATRMWSHSTVGQDDFKATSFSNAGGIVKRATKKESISDPNGWIVWFNQKGQSMAELRDIGEKQLKAEGDS